MRSIQFVLLVANLTFALFVLIQTLFPQNAIDPVMFVWSLLYFITALSLTHLYMLYLANKIDDWYDVESMKGIAKLSLTSLVICALALSIRLGIKYYYDNKLFASGYESLKEFIPLAGALINSIVLLSSSFKFKRYVALCRSAEVPTQVLPSQRNYRTVG